MIQIEVKYQGKKRIVDFPTGWDDLTFGQFLAIRQYDDERDGAGRLLEILSGVEKEAWMNMHAGVGGTIASLLEWTTTPHNFDVPPGKKITIDGKDYRVPHDLGMHAYGQKLTLETKVAKAMEENRDLFEIMPDAMAIYFQPIIQDAPFNDQKAEELKDVFNKCRAAEVYPIASFFLKSSDAYQGYGKPPLKPGGGESTAAYRRKRGSGILKRLTGLFSWFTHSHKKPGGATIRFI